MKTRKDLCGLPLLRPGLLLLYGLGRSIILWSLALIAALVPSVARGAVSVSISPKKPLIGASQSIRFHATVTGSNSSFVSWSVRPQIGTISSLGVYTAPPFIGQLNKVLIVATSAADPAVSATVVAVLAPVSVGVTPHNVSLGATQTQQFSATVNQSNDSAVAWSLTPTVGTILNGLYAAPTTIGAVQTVVLTATSIADPTKTAQALITLTPQSIQLPVEVIGLDGTIVTVPFNILSGSNLSGVLTLSMSVHGLRYETQASVQVNNSGWQAISDTTVTLLGNASAYGGIGGGFSTLKMTMSVPAGALTQGTNTISFRFNGTDGRVSGFRVLSFNFLDASGNSLLSPTAFVYENPNTWQPPSSQASDIAAGKTLWYTAPLTNQSSGGPVSIQAHCTDCHTQDGRDLKYFNYSNNSIRTRAMFHGLTAQQGDQIASYIRTINVVNPGRPWNPPYQPGPGMDSQPVINWAAGAGIDAVLDSDQQLMTEIFPSGIVDSVFSGSGNLNARETAIPYQLPDWNQWLPGTHPIDGFGTDFTTNAYSTLYQTIRSQLNVLDPVAFTNQKPNLQSWLDAYYGLFRQEGPVNPSLWTPDVVDKMYGLAQWGMVKTWEMMNQFQLEGFAQNIFGPQADPRAWYGNQPFFTSPHMVKIPSASVGLRNGKASTYTYLSYIWYHLQLILNNSNKEQADWHPIDWPYTYGFINSMSDLLQPQAGDRTLWLIKALQISNSGRGPDLGTAGWQPGVNDLTYLVENESYNEWLGVPSATRIAISEGFIRSWLSQVTQFTPQQFYTGGFASPSVNPVPGNPFGAFADKVWFWIPRFHNIGVNQTLINSLAAWAQTVWPNANWTTTTTATCTTPQATAVSCTTE